MINGKNNEMINIQIHFLYKNNKCAIHKEKNIFQKEKSTFL